ncbi:4Fe-4S binding protein [Tomitella gaofuii]|uniref:4Fe-4S binding protein n=1 Tax=Tomitella gaofuii TaxID=2760083 RepID=UPI0015F95F5D|nr:4Fe-4S binding protein [Tomitella gaofuii]
MTYVITQSCCNDTACVDVCPVDCIRPRMEDELFTTAEQLYIDPASCIDCGACVDACPVDAIFPEHQLPAGMDQYTRVNKEYFDKHPLELLRDPSFPTSPIAVPGDISPLRVAVVGAGPAAMYAVDALTSHGGGNVEIEVFERSPSPWGLARGGVAPDHQRTRTITNIFKAMMGNPAVRAHLNVEVGKHISHAELLRHHHAVVYGVGASTDRHLNIDGEGLPGSVAATDFVAWYNGDPDHADDVYDLGGERAVVIGNGNVALDVARVLATSPDQLAQTDIAEHALEALRASTIREVVVLGRRGPVQAAFTSKELLGLDYVDGMDIIVDPADLVLDEQDEAFLASEACPFPVPRKIEQLRGWASRSSNPTNRRIVLKFLASPTAILGEGHVEKIQVARNELVADGTGRRQARPTGESDTIETGLILRSVGYRGAPADGVPFDERRGIIPNNEGRVIHPVTGEPVTGVYVTGWIKRGPSGYLGTNKKCAQDTIKLLRADVEAGRLTRQVKDRRALERLLAERQPDAISFDEWRVLDRAELARGKATGRPRVRYTDTQEMVDLAKGRG